MGPKNGSQNGRLQHGGPQHGGPKNGGAQNGGAQNGGAQNGGAQNGGAQNGEPIIGEPKNGELKNDGSLNGGPLNSGSENDCHQPAGRKRWPDKAQRGPAIWLEARNEQHEISTISTLPRLTSPRLALSAIFDYTPLRFLLIVSTSAAPAPTAPHEPNSGTKISTHCDVVQYSASHRETRTKTRQVFPATKYFSGKGRRVADAQ